MKEKLLRPVKPNPGIRSWYRRQIEKLIDALRRSLMWWLVARYKTRSATQIQKELDSLRLYWLGMFDDSAKRIAKRYVQQVNRAVSSSMKSALTDVGFNIIWKNDRNVQNVLRSLRDTQVSLIKSIPQEELNRVSGILNRGLQNGQDLAAIKKEMENSFGISKRRARVIAIDQTNKATFAINRARGIQVGVKEAIWIHIAGRYTSRPTHVAMHHKRFFLEGKDAGMYDDDVGHRVMPGELVNCMCHCRMIVPPLGQK